MMQVKGHTRDIYPHTIQIKQKNTSLERIVFFYLFFCCVLFVVDIVIRLELMIELRCSLFCSQS